MPIGHSSYYIPAVWIIWIAFLGLVLLAAFYVQILHWESMLACNQERWLRQLKHTSRTMRTLRLRSAQLSMLEPLGLLQPLFRGVWVVAFWVLRWILSTKAC